MSALSLRDFFLSHQSFWRENSCRVLTANSKPSKTIAVSNTYGLAKAMIEQASSATARNHVIYFPPRRSLADAPARKCREIR